MDVTPARAEAFARAWGSRFVNIGEAGHINSASERPDWPRGKELVAELAGAPES